MKSIKTANGIKRIEECAESVALVKIREILTDHRNTLINRLILDLPVYLSYRFNIKCEKEQLQSITDRLYSLKHYPIDLDKYDALTQTILANVTTHLNTELFYKEIDQAIRSELNQSPMVLVK
jgi:hypothetical protein